VITRDLLQTTDLDGTLGFGETRDLIAGAGGTVTVRLSKKALRELGRGRALLVLEVNGKVISKKTLRFA